ncbi:MAG: bifunctional nuclease family protein [Muribaculaceae bacterium]|nr:bifunctional nuclease family protein [Muribaculaceae bacterium]
MKKRHELKLIGITYNQIESGVYALILEEVNGARRIPIIIGYPEAQSIECKLQNIKTPRPLTHDLLRVIMESFELTLLCVDIHKLDNGVFAADLVMQDKDGNLRHIDARSSDAIALAIRTGSPIYTDAEVLEESGFLPRTESNSVVEKEDVAQNDAGHDSNPENMSYYSDAEIAEMIARLAAEEKYEEAARLQDILRKRKNGD